MDIAAEQVVPSDVVEPLQLALQRKTATVGIVGLGYVGLPLVLNQAYSLGQ